MQGVVEAVIKLAVIIILLLTVVIIFEHDKKMMCDKTKTLILDGEVYHCEAIYYDDNKSSRNIQEIPNIYRQRFTIVGLQQLNEDS